jgi:histone acetyltransferase (RNA polymerase elongator complex component)
MSVQSLKIVPYFVNHQGCPHECRFCNQRVINRQQTADLEDFEAFMTKFAQLHYPTNTYQLAFFGGSFTAIEPQLMLGYLKRGQEAVREGLIKNMRCSTRPDSINETILDCLKSYGVAAVELGVQSFNDRVLIQTQRGHTAEDAIRASCLIKASGLELGHQLMLGLPTDTFEDFQNSVSLSISLKPDTVRLYPTQVLVDTVLAEDYKRGLYSPLSLDEALKWSKWAVLRYQSAGVKVIKVGLQSSESLMDPDVRLAGPYHPAYGEWVDSLIVQDRMQWGLDQLKSNNPKEESLLVYCHPKWISKVIGLSKINVVWIKEQYRMNLKVEANSAMSEGDLTLILGRRAIQLPAQR